MTYLVKPNWIGFDGQPITGVIPPRLRLMSGVMTPTLASEVAHRYKIFHLNKQASRAEYFVTDTALPDGSRLRIVANGRIEDVLVWSEAKGDPKDGADVALAYPVVPLPSYAPIFDRYVFDREFTPDPPIPYPDEPVFESTTPLPVIDNEVAYYTVTEVITPHAAPEWHTSATTTTTTQIDISGAITEYSFSLWTLDNYGTVVDSSWSGTLVSVSSGRDGPVPGEWPRVLLTGQLLVYDGINDPSPEYQGIPELVAMNGRNNANAIAANLAYQAAVAAEYAAWQSSTYAEWVAACEAIDVINNDRVMSIDAAAESIALRKDGRSDQIAAYKSWIDAGISDRHITWAMFDAPAMTASKPVLPVDFTLGSAPLDSEGYEDDVGYYAHYMLTRANRETVLDAGSGGGGNN